jgi:uncharacterized membrane protein
LFFELAGTRGAAPETGLGADYAGSFIAQRVIRAEREGFGCEQDLSSFLYRASGNEPSWQLLVGRESIRFTSMAGDSLSIRGPALTREAGSVHATARSEDGEINAVLEAERCTDSMAGSVFGWSARVVVGDAVYDGCATRGLSPDD